MPSFDSPIAHCYPLHVCVRVQGVYSLWVSMRNTLSHIYDFLSKYFQHYSQSLDDSFGTDHHGPTLEGQENVKIGEAVLPSTRKQVSFETTIYEMQIFV